MLFAETFFVEKDSDTGAPWRLWPYQKVPPRYRGNTIHECGAEVGKTREIVLLLVWMLLGFGPKRRGEILVGAAQDGHLDTLYGEVEFQLRATPWLDGQIDWQSSKVKPYRKLVAKNGNVAHFRPAGYDGEAFRSIHAGLALFGDEVAKWKNRKHFDEFFRAAKPSAEIRLYSTPDGDRNSRFYELAQAALQVSSYETPPEPPRAADGATVRRFLKFRWRKSEAPAPYWSEARRQAFVEQWGGIDSPGYQQNVEGAWGDAVNAVFPWEHFEPATRYDPEYLEAKLLYNATERRFYVSAARLNPAFEPSARLGDESERAPAMLLPTLDQEIDEGNLDLEALLSGIFQRARSAHFAGGIDCGSTDDPTEILLAEVLGDRRRVFARLQLRRFTYPMQRSVVRALERAVGEPSFGWGLDAGGVGSALEHLLVEGEARWSLDGRLSGFVPNAKTVDRNPESGEPVCDPGSEAPRKVSNKELATRLLELGLQHRRHLYPRSPDFLQQFPNHTARKGSSGDRIFAKTNDHLIDARRYLELRIFELEHGDGAAVPIVYRTPGDSRLGGGRWARDESTAARAIGNSDNRRNPAPW